MPDIEVSIVTTSIESDVNPVSMPVTIGDSQYAVTVETVNQACSITETSIEVNIQGAVVVGAANHSDLILDDGTNPHGTTMSDVVDRDTIVSDTVLTAANQYISIDASSNPVDFTLNASPSDGDFVDAFIVDDTNTVTVTGNINGSPIVFQMYEDESIQFIYNADKSTWEARV